MSEKTNFTPKDKQWTAEDEFRVHMETGTLYISRAAIKLLTDGKGNKYDFDKGEWVSDD